MYWITKTLQLGRALCAALLATLSARPAAALLTTPTVRLFTAGPTLTPDAAAASFTEPTFTGYAVVPWTTPAGPLNTGPQTVSEEVNCTFTASGATSPTQNILGYFITDSATPPTLFFGAEYFDTPVPIVHAGDFINVTVVVPQFMVPDRAA